MIPKAGSTQYGLTQLQTFDWTAPTDIKSVNLPVHTMVVYGGPQSIYISASGYNDTYEAYACQPSKPPVIGQVMYFDYTYIHEFDFKTSTTVAEYMGTGVFPGKILNQFSVDEYQEHFRVASGGDLLRYVDGGGGTVDTEWERSSHVFTLEIADGKELKIMGRVDGIGKNEDIYATRFIEDKAYVVTFRKKDPLTVVDLKDPAKPAILAELTIPGFSEYVHPIGTPVTHLLTIGKETDSNSTVVGVAVQVFDVTNPTTPTLQQKFVFDGDSWGYSEAENNHKAFNYLPDKGILMFPYITDQYAYSEFHSFLEVFKIDTAGGADKSITKLGAISHDDLFNEYWWTYCKEVYGAGVRRGVFITDNIYSLSYGGIKVHALSDLNTLIKSLPFTSPGGLGMQCAMP